MRTWLLVLPLVGLVPVGCVALLGNDFKVEADAGADTGAPPPPVPDAGDAGADAHDSGDGAIPIQTAAFECVPQSENGANPVAATKLADITFNVPDGGGGGGQFDSRSTIVIKQLTAGNGNGRMRVVYIGATSTGGNNV